MDQTERQLFVYDLDLSLVCEPPELEEDALKRSKDKEERRKREKARDKDQERRKRESDTVPVGLSSTELQTC